MKTGQVDQYEKVSEKRKYAGIQFRNACRLDTAGLLDSSCSSGASGSDVFCELQLYEALLIR